SEACQHADARAAPETWCRDYENLKILKLSSIWLAIGGLGVVACVWLTALLCRGNQRLLASVFGVQVRLVLASASVLIFAQGAILLYAVYMAETTLAGSIFPPLAGAIRMGAIAGGVAMAEAAAKLSPRLRISALALEVPRASHPKLWSFVDDIAAKVG